MDQQLAERVRAWQRAGVIDGVTAAAIDRFESSSPPVGQPATITRGISASEMLAYVGVALAVGGIVYAVLNDAGQAVGGPVMLALAAVAVALGFVLLRDVPPPGRRAAGAALTIGASLAALGCGRILVVSGAFASSHLVPAFDGGPSSVVTERNNAAIGAISAGVALALGLAALRLAVVVLPALLVTASAYVAAMTGLQAIGGDAAQRTGAAPLVAGAGLLALSWWPHLRPVREQLRFGAAVVPVPALLLLGGATDAATWPLIAAAALVTLAALFGAVRLASNALAVAGGLGAFGVAVDVTARTLGSSGGAPVVLIVSGVILIGCAALAREAIRRNQRRVAV